jgi:hypothetical protein
VQLIPACWMMTYPRAGVCSCQTLPAALTERNVFLDPRGCWNTLRDDSGNQHSLAERDKNSRSQGRLRQNLPEFVAVVPRACAGGWYRPAEARRRRISRGADRGQQDTLRVSFTDKLRGCRSSPWLFRFSCDPCCAKPPELLDSWPTPSGSRPFVVRNHFGFEYDRSCDTLAGRGCA